MTHTARELLTLAALGHQVSAEALNTVELDDHDRAHLGQRLGSVTRLYHQGSVRSANALAASTARDFEGANR